MRRLLLLALLALVLPAAAHAQGQNFPGPCPSGWSAQLQVTAAASITLPFQSGSCVTDFFITLNIASTTVTAITGPFIAGSEIGITITQDVTGGRTFTLPANFLNVPATQAGSLASTAYTFQYCGALGSGTSCPAGDWQNTDVGPAGTGTVTVVSAGNLTSTAVVTGGGGQAIQTPSATTTLDSSGNLTLAGHVSTGAGCTPAGATAAGGICMTDSAATGWTPTAGFSYIRASSVSNNLVCSLNGGGETTNCFGAAPSLDQITGAAAVSTATETGAGNVKTFAGVETNSLTVPYVLTNANSTNNNSSGALIVGTTGSSTGAVPLRVNEATSAGNFVEMYTGGTVTNGVISGQTKTFSVAPTGAVAIGSSAPTCAGGGAGPGCFTEGTAPTAASSVDDLHADSTQHAIEVNNNNTGEMPISRAQPSCVNVTPVTVSANVTTDQNLMTCTFAANLLNVVGRTIKIYSAGTYSTAAASSAAMTVKAKLCTVSGCGSGTVIAICNIVSSALGAITVANNTWTMECISITQTAGASSVYEHSGRLSIDLLVANAAADSIFLDPNATAVTSAIDSTGQIFLQISGAFSAASTSNSFTQRQLIVEVLN